MKLVGATNEYVRKPLIYQGMFYGLISAFISGLLLAIIIAALNYFALIPGTFGLGFLANFTISSFLYSLVLWFVLILSGLLLGYFGSSYAVKRYLKY
jgi:cell division transport system permease protein